MDKGQVEEVLELAHEDIDDDELAMLVGSCIQTLQSKVEKYETALKGMIDASHGMGGDFDEVMMSAINKATAALSEVDG